MPRWCAWSADKPSAQTNVEARDQGPRGISALRQKMASYISNGAQLGWLLLPEEQAVEIWRADRSPAEPERLAQVSQLDGNPLLPGFFLELNEIWNP